MPDAYPSVQTLAGRCGVERKTVMRALERLERIGVIAVERSPGRINRYVFQGDRSLWRTGPGLSPVRDVGTSPESVQVPERDGTGPKNVLVPVPNTPKTSPNLGPEADRKADPESRERSGARAREGGTKLGPVPFDAPVRTVTMPGADPTESYLASCVAAG